MVLFHQIMVL